MSEVISEEYRKQQMELHKNPNYGVASLMYAPIVADLIRMFNFRSVGDAVADLLAALAQDHDDVKRRAAAQPHQ